MAHWVGPFTVRELLEGVVDGTVEYPPESNGVYLVTEHCWSGEPDKNSGPLYVGSNTGKRRRFRTRVGELIAHVLGFYCDETGHHSGGQRLHEYCVDNEINPLDLYIGWFEDVENYRAAEVQFVDELKPLLNKRRPSEKGGMHE